MQFYKQAKNQAAEIYLIFFLNFCPRFSLILYLFRLDTNNKNHFLNNGETGILNRKKKTNLVLNFVSFNGLTMKNQFLKKLQLRHLRLEIYITFS